MDLVGAVEEIARSLPAAQVETLASELQRHSGPTGEARSRVIGVVPTPQFADRARRLLDAWATADEMSGASLAVALRAAARSVDAERGQESIEVVWTGPTTGEVPVRLTREALIEVIRAAQRSLIVVSFAAYKVQEVVDELARAAGRGVVIRLILETDRAGGGTLTLDATAAFRDLKGVASFYIWPTEKRPPLERGRAALHAKAAIADDHTALVTSANLTGNAIASNMELGLLIRGGPVPRRLAGHFNRLLSDRVLEEILA